MRKQSPSTKREPTIALINVVFLMLIFFLIAGTVAPSLDQDITLIRTKDIDLTSPPEGLVILPDGTLLAQGKLVPNVEAFVATLQGMDFKSVRLIPDQTLPAADLLRIGAALRRGGVKTVLVASERVLE